MKQDNVARAIDAGAVEMGQRLPDGAAQKMSRLLSELQRWGARFNLTAIRDLEAMISGHVLDSLAVRPFIAGTRVIDVGTGAGFPGLPLAIAAPHLRFELLDSNAKKIAFVRHIIGELGVSNASAVQSRAQDYAPDARFDTVIGRALTTVGQLVELAGHLVGNGGVLLAQKGKYPLAELRQLTNLPDSWDYSVTELTVPGLAAHSRHVVCLRRNACRA